ncbi:hypothetical protein LUZ63_000192 [Rhynchospora breviuscula]|uniref:R13L1/DRL21-like LRR repeat region domain-containing protein n=1 Tax=Rhynchospora breviuscula TaxID=2022672 RepID=A0A9Q0CUV2_9POAL|nr:hypothetical protein LUZ63_000192 [Rhynchospora breviuscula]
MYADSRALSLISDIGQLTDLQELNVFHVRKERGYKITELKNMRMLSGELRIMGIENVSNKEEARDANLTEKKNIDILGLYHEPSNKPDSREILQALQPHPDLKELIISGYEGCSLPEWFQELTSIQKIIVENCPKLESMAGLPPILEKLSIQKCSKELMEQCSEIGAQWLNIKHVQRIFVGEQQIK